MRELRLLASGGFFLRTFIHFLFLIIIRLECEQWSDCRRRRHSHVLLIITLALCFLLSLVQFDCFLEQLGLEGALIFIERSLEIGKFFNVFFVDHHPSFRRGAHWQPHLSVLRPHILSCRRSCCNSLSKGHIVLAQLHLIQYLYIEHPECSHTLLKRRLRVHYHLTGALSRSEQALLGLRSWLFTDYLIDQTMLEAGSI